RSRLPRPQRDARVRYERERPGELLHVDTKQLGRFFAVGKRILQDGLPRSRRAGWQHLHVAIDDHTRLAYTELLPSAGNRARAGALRQRQGLPLQPLARHLQPARDRAPLHASLLTVDKRQSRSADQNTPPRIGLPLRLPHQHPPRTRPPQLHQVVQPTPTPQLARRPTADQPRLTPLWSVQLAPPAGNAPGV